MKKFYYLLASIAIVLITIIACEEASIEVDEIQAVQDEVLLAKGAKADKVTICHWDDGFIDIIEDGVKTGEEWDHEPQWVWISISMNAMDKHMANHSNGDDVFDHLPKTYYLDFDGDGFGDSSNYAENECEAPDGYVEDNTDCDDGDNTMHESFDFYVDGDGDGFGAGDLVSECAVDATTPPLGFSLTNTDCDDGVFAINPGATEICGDGIDNNCDGDIDENDYSYQREYTIYRSSNGAVLNIIIHADDTITGEGYTGGGSPVAQTYTGTVVVNGDYTTLMLVDQDPQGGQHSIEGIVSQCDGITSLTNGYTFSYVAPH